MNEIPIEIDVQTLQTWREQGKEFVLVDCRETSEYQIAKIPGSQLMPMSIWETQAEQLKGMEDKPIVVHCHHGGRSMRVTQWLRQHGFVHAQNLAGGIDAWSRDIDPQVPRY